MTQPCSLTLISLLPDAHGGVGHHVGYHASVGKAATACGWRHTALVSADETRARLPVGWRTVLRTGLLTRGLPESMRKGKLLSLFGDMRTFARSLAAEVNAELAVQPGECILFLDDFNGPQLLAVYWAMRRLPRARLHFWLLWRYDPMAGGAIGWIYRNVALLLAKLFPSGQFQLLTDSEPLACALEHALGLPAKVMPIPHTAMSASGSMPRREDEIVCWWPGAPRPEKGLAEIRALVDAGRADRGTQPLRVVLSTAAGVRGKGCEVEVQEIPAALSASDYQAWMQTADFILLPYDPARYRLATSGIFAECLAAGKIPLTRRGTWMEFELARFGLQELALDWRDPRAILDAIRAMRSDASLRQRLDQFRRAFLAFHSEPSFAREMQALLRDPAGSSIGRQAAASGPG